MIALTPGAKASMSHVVREEDLATNWRNDVPVLATPVLLWLAELACMQATDHNLEPERMSLGVKHEMTHCSPTPLGWTVEIDAELIDVDGKFLTYAVVARDRQDIVLEGTHTRAVVRRAPFVDGVEKKARPNTALP